jgi:uncharacterized protein YtpQ (UPF0354 family)
MNPFDCLRNFFKRKTIQPADGSNPRLQRLDDIDIREAIAYLKILVPGSEADSVAAVDDGRVVMSPFVGDLVVTYVVDTDDKLQFVQNRHLNAAGMDHRQLHDLGIRNLFRQLKIGSFDVHDVGPFHAVTLDGHFEASLLLIDSLWDEVLIKLASNGAVAAVPARDFLVFCDRADALAIEHMRQYIRKLDDGMQPLTMSLFERDTATRRWQVFES